jgi:hypothetical protein
MILGKSPAKESVLILGEVGRHANPVSAPATRTSSTWVAARSSCGGRGSREARNGLLPAPTRETEAAGTEKLYGRNASDESGQEM